MATDDLPPPVVREVRCPGCGGAAVYAASNPFRPFCGERCRNGDLGAWASGSYRVADAPSLDTSDDWAKPDGD
jgi:uncharacterized protein